MKEGASRANGPRVKGSRANGKANGRKANGRKANGSGTNRSGPRSWSLVVYVRKNRSRWVPWVAVLSVLSFIAALALGVFVLVGCVSTNGFVEPLYLVEIGTNTTNNVQLQVGYFGGCVSIPNMTEAGSSNGSLTHCVMNMRGKNMQDLSEEFLEGLNSGAQLNSSLTQVLHLAEHLQSDVFHWAPPIADLILFTISGSVLFMAATNRSSKRSYRFLLMMAVLSSAFALAMAFVTTIGTLQALNGLVDGNQSKQLRWVDGVAIQRADQLYTVQAAQVSLFAMFYLLMGLLFTRSET